MGKKKTSKKDNIVVEEKIKNEEIEIEKEEEIHQENETNNIVLNDDENGLNDVINSEEVTEEIEEIPKIRSPLYKYTKHYVCLSIARIFLLAISFGLVKFCLIVNNIGRMTPPMQGLLCAMLIYIMFFLIFYPINGIIKTINIFKLYKQNEEKKIRYIVLNIVFILTYFIDLYGLYFVYLIIFKGV